MRLIDPDELERVLRPILTDESCPLHIAAEIDMNLDLMPKVDAVPVRYGHWIEDPNDWECQCSECGRLSSCRTVYCSACGARMYGKGNGDE